MSLCAGWLIKQRNVFAWLQLISFSSFRETVPSQRRELGHAPGVGPNPSGAQQSIETT